MADVVETAGVRVSYEFVFIAIFRIKIKIKLIRSLQFSMQHVKQFFENVPVVSVE